MLLDDAFGDELLQEILLQLEGELIRVLRRVADGALIPGTVVEELAKEAHKAALASRLVCRRWRGLGDHAVATTRIRMRLGKRQLMSSCYANFIVEDLPAARQLQRNGCGTN